MRQAGFWRKQLSLKIVLPSGQICASIRAAGHGSATVDNARWHARPHLNRASYWNGSHISRARQLGVVSAPVLTLNDQIPLIFKLVTQTFSDNAPGD